MLTSIDENEMKEIGYINNMEQQVMKMAEISYRIRFKWYSLFCTRSETCEIKISK